MAQPAPEISVVVPTHRRPLRLRWLLNALAEQTLPREHFEVIVAHAVGDAETEQLLTTHPLTKHGVLRHLPAPPQGGPGANRNSGWQMAGAPVIAFTDDDCRPPPDWVEHALDAARRHPGAV